MPTLPKETGMIFYGAPVMFRNTLLGVLGFGKIKNATGNEKRFITMIADLAGVSLQNCERLSTAQHQANTDALTGLYTKNILPRGRSLRPKGPSLIIPLYHFLCSI